MIGKTMRLVFIFLLWLIILAVLVCVFLIGRNLLPIKCRSIEDLNCLLNADLTNASITDIETDVDYSDGYTTVVVFLNDDDFISHVMNYHQAGWLEYLGCEEPKPPGDLQILQQYGILPSRITSYGYTYRSIKSGFGETDYQIRCYQIDDLQQRGSCSYVLVAGIPRILSIHRTEDGPLS